MSENKPNEIGYFNITADGVNITSMMVQCDIFQDIYSPTWSCQILFSDTQNIVMNVPIVPGTLIRIIAESDERKVYDFIVYKISDRNQQKQEHQIFRLHCVTPEFFTNQKARVSRGFQTKSPSSIVSTIISESGLGSIEDADTDSNNYTVIIPNLSPFSAINWLSRFAISSSNGADFSFFQSDVGKFKFKSLEKMFKDRSSVVFVQQNPNVTADDDNFFNIEYYEFISQHNSINNFAQGYYGNTVISHNILDKTFDELTFAFGDDIPDDKTNKTFNGTHFDGAELSNITFHPIAPDSSATRPADTYDVWMQSRKSNVMKLEENRLVITVPGVTSHYKLIGRQVDVNLPSQQDIDEAEYLDKYMKGAYVVAAIRQTFTTDFYKCTFELTKKRLKNSL